jgi:enolase
MSKIKSVKGRQVFDSRGNPTTEAEILLFNGVKGTAIVPSGASTGAFEAYELRDGDKKQFLGKGVLKAVRNINQLSKILKNKNINEQKKIDNILIKEDGSDNKKKLGANCILAVSLAVAQAAANNKKKSLFRYLGKGTSLPRPLMNIINGGAHADNELRIQEFMIRPDSAKNFTEALNHCYLVINNLKKILKTNGYSVNVGDEGGFAPNLKSNEDALNYIIEAINASGLIPGKDIVICLDVAANELYQDDKYSIRDDRYESIEETLKYYQYLVDKYPIKSIEDPFAEDDWESWIKITSLIGKKVQIVGDDLFVTNYKRLKRGIEQKAANCILVKVNQIGSLQETMDVIELAKKNKIKYIISHRSGDTEDTFIADIAVATNANQIKTGSLARSERVAKYNRLLRIEEELGKRSKMAKI